MLGNQSLASSANYCLDLSRFIGAWKNLPTSFNASRWWISLKCIPGFHSRGGCAHFFAKGNASGKKIHFTLLQLFEEVDGLCENRKMQVISRIFQPERAVRDDGHVGRMERAGPEQRVRPCLVRVIAVAAGEDQPAGGPGVRAAAAGRRRGGRVAASAEHHPRPALDGLRTGEIDGAENVERGFAHPVRLNEVRERRHARRDDDRHHGE